jgi:hypothetical protein
MTTQICLTQSMMDCGMPAMVMACSVELGSISPVTWTWPPVLAQISLILQPPFQLKSHTD